jgi:hypothetical protein
LRFVALRPGCLGVFPKDDLERRPRVAARRFVLAHAFRRTLPSIWQWRANSLSQVSTDVVVADGDPGFEGPVRVIGVGTPKRETSAAATGLRKTVTAQRHGKTKRKRPFHGIVE